MAAATSQHTHTHTHTHITMDDVPVFRAEELEEACIFLIFINVLSNNAPIKIVKEAFSTWVKAFCNACKAQPFWYSCVAADALCDPDTGLPFKTHPSSCALFANTPVQVVDEEDMRRPMMGVLIAPPTEGTVTCETLAVKRLKKECAELHYMPVFIKSKETAETHSMLTQRLFFRAPLGELLILPMFGSMLLRAAKTKDRMWLRSHCAWQHWTALRRSVSWGISRKHLPVLREIGADAIIKKFNVLDHTMLFRASPLTVLDTPELEIKAAAAAAPPYVAPPSFTHTKCIEAEVAFADPVDSTPREALDFTHFTPLKATTYKHVMLSSPAHWWGRDEPVFQPRSAFAQLVAERNREAPCAAGGGGGGGGGLSPAEEALVSEVLAAEEAEAAAADKLMAEILAEEEAETKRKEAKKQKKRAARAAKQEADLIDPVDRGSNAGNAVEAVPADPFDPVDLGSSAGSSAEEPMDPVAIPDKNYYF